MTQGLLLLSCAFISMIVLSMDVMGLYFWMIPALKRVKKMHCLIKIQSEDLRSLTQSNLH
uniref:Uncharacterized protein n=1 Tax=Lotus japonicus TaxID=34305 RepID=I3T459_LOTJA|nr:unknown [Lotus japonicus]